jgi:hypothetical protein
MVGGFRRSFCIRGLTALCQYLRLSYRSGGANPLVGSSTGHCEVVAKAAIVFEVVEVEIVVAL